ncbi:MAG: UrcA family protein [Pseudomonadota bacterium]
MRFTVSSLIALSFLGAANASTVETIEVEITYNRDAVQTQEGAQATLNHIVREARKDCRVGAISRSVIIGSIDQNCVADITLKAVSKIDAPMLTKLFEQSQSN